MKWGLVPFWSKTPTVKYRTINARAETIVKAPAYRVPIRKHRCLVPANHFFEWSQKSEKRPYLFKLKSAPVFSIAGIFDIWKDAEGKEFESFAMITTSANKMMSAVHHRMPVIIPRRHEERWLDHDKPLSDATELMKPYPSDDMAMHPVDKAVNKPIHDSLEIIKAVD